LVEAISPTWDS